MLPFSSNSVSPEMVRALVTRPADAAAGGMLTLAVVCSLATATAVVAAALAGSL
ncbi:MAG: hypothetical protein ABUL48_02040 [Pseudorhodoplanes sp.]